MKFSGRLGEQRSRHRRRERDRFEERKALGIYLRLRLEPKLKSSPKLPTLPLFLFPLQFQKPKGFYVKIQLCVIGVSFMIWGLDFVAFDEHIMLNVFCESWGFRRPLG